ncbi:MAG: diphthine synthase [Candidatus Hydrothermarchaeaceae archaeon]
MLVFVGMGLNDEKDISLKGLEEARSADVLFAEFYTSYMSVGTKEFESLIGREITVLKREDVEEKEEVILRPAADSKVVLLVPGDPLISTTHIHLRIEAKRRGIETRIIHSASIVSAAASLSGLQNYKFGRSASVAIPETGFTPETPYDVLRENLERGLHTLLFLDVKVKDGKAEYLTANRAIGILLDIEERRGEDVFPPNRLCVVLARAGSANPTLKAGIAGALMKEDSGSPPHTLIVPGRLHFMEEEYLKEFGGLG